MKVLIATLCTFFLLVTIAPGSAAAQPATQPAPRPAALVLAVDGDVPHPLKLTIAQVATMPHRDLKVKDRRGQEVTYSGVLLGDLVMQAGIAMNAGQMRAEFLHLVLIVKGADGYRVTFSLAELNEALGGRPAFLADRRDGQPLDQNEGPFRVIAPGDTLPARWVRQAAGLTIKNLEKD